MEGGDENATMVPVSTPTISRGGNLSLMIGDAWSPTAPGALESFAINNGALDLFKKVLTQSDKNYTFFSVDNQADLMGGVDIQVITKSLSPMYNGQVVSKK